MSRTSLSLCACVLGALGVSATFGDDLAALAAKEKARRTGKAGRTYTESDLLRLHWEAWATDSVVPQATGSEASDSEPSDDLLEAVADAEEGDGEARSAAWRSTLNEAQGDAGRLAQEVERLRGQLGDLREGLYGPGRAQQADHLSKLSEGLTSARGRVALLEESGRKRGYTQ